MTLSRACTRTTTRTSIECTRASSRNRLYRRGALNTGVLRYGLPTWARADQTGLDYFLFQRRAGHCE